MILTIPRLIIGTLIIAGAGTGALLLLSSDLPPATPLEDLPDLLHRRIGERIAAELPAPGGDRRLLLPPVSGDRDEALRTRLARSVDRRYEVLLADAPPESFLESEVLPRLAEWLGAIPGISAEDRPRWLLEARIESRRDDVGALALQVGWRLRDLAADGRPAAVGSAEEHIERSLGDLDYLRWRIGEIPVWARAGTWLAVLVVPWLLARRLFLEVLRMESNRWNGVLWALAAAPGVITGYILTSFAAGVGGAALAVLAGVVSSVLALAHLGRLEAARR